MRAAAHKISYRFGQFRTTACALVCLAVLIAPGNMEAQTDSPDDLLIVAHILVPVDRLSPVELETIFLKQRGSWRGGGKIVAINAKKGTELRKQFARRALDMTPEEEQDFWEDQKVRKGIDAPPEFTNTLKAVFKLRGSISYVRRRDYRENVSKILLVLRK